jgi:DnaK suppressor protein
MRDVFEPCAEPDTPDPTDHSLLRRILNDHRRSRLDQLEGLRRHDSDADIRLDAGTRKRMILATHMALAEIEAALQRYDEGTYGWCAQCLSPIPVRDLMHYPQMRYHPPCLSRC